MAEAIINSDEPNAEIGGLLPTSSGEKSLFCRKIEFHLARKPFTGFRNGNGDFRLETLNPSPLQPESNQVNGRLPFAKKIPEENGLDAELKFEMTFRKIVKIGAGLENLGNTCFLNSVLQCLTYTEPLAAYLQSGKHQVSCRTAGFCALCAIERHVSRALQSTGRIVSPKELVSNLRCISRNFRNSRQEDAHEYMVNFLEAMHKCCLPAGVHSGSPSAYQKSLIHKIFGGRLRSQVKCLQCNHCSDTFDPFLDLSLEISKADSVYKALSDFTAKEQLDGGERHYQCERCKQKVRALKQLTVHKAPDVLIVHLKRFGSHHQGQKIDKKIIFAPNLDLRPFVTGSYDGDMKYSLFGVLVHAGWSTHSGHYFSFVRTSSGMWYNLDDNRVVQVSEKRVLDQKAYMLFYTREGKYFAPKKPIQVLPKENMASINGGIKKQNPPPNFNQAMINKTTTLINGPVRIQSNSSVLLTQLDSSKESSSQKVNVSDNKDLNGRENLIHLDEEKVVNAVTIISNGNASGNTVTDKKIDETEKSSSEKNNIDLIIEQSNCNLLQKSATNISLENGHKASSLNVDANDLEKIKPSQIVDTAEKNTSSDLTSEYAFGKGQKSADSVSETAQMSARKKYKKDLDYKPNQMRKMKHCTRVTMHLSASIFYASTLKLKTKKNKRAKKNKLGFENLNQVPDLGPSTSEKISQIFKRESDSKKENCIVKNGDVSDYNSDVATVNDKFSNGNYHSGAVLTAVHEKKQKISSNSEVNDLKDEKNNSKQYGLLNMLRRGLDDTIVKGWDEMETYPLISKDESKGARSLTIGYIGDEWDVEYDRGKRKKNRGVQKSFGGSNPFQEIATSKANCKKAKVDHQTVL